MQQRLFEILWTLTRNGTATAGQLAQKFGVSTRTIYRDIDALSGAGIPVYAEKGRGGGIRLLPGFVLDKALLSKAEQAQLLANLDSLSSLGAPDARQTLDKLAALFGTSQSWIQVDFAPWGGGEEMRRLFRLLQSAILGHHLITFNYTGATGQTAPRKVEPYRAVFRGQGWYLYGYSLERQDFRYFKLNRMQNPVDTGQTFQPRTLPAPPPTEGWASPPLKVRLRFGPKATFRVLEEYTAAQRTPAPGGGFVVEADFPDEGAWLVGYLLSYGPGVEVLAPESLRQKVAEALRQASGLYAEN